ncbi:hypothetical protein RHGRI_031113 [Rhododendron griersonianum]|uniref:non-specific serine/threonine protein kinase n=2 Tax=Rhododendron griersonianum TaxID=479676 RepID=A0AAV6I6P0_9ERIC|nr:hypothetical protein RHGRI_031113 [Rhododendron griersonianum]
MTNFGWITISASHFTNETDRRALFTIRDSIPGDPFHVFSSWNRSIAFCDWQGVTCGRRHQRVTMLNLSSLQLVGSMSPHIGNLTFLRTIDLSNNSFRGVIPREVGRLVRLRYLLLSVNSFHDVFPTNSSSLSGIKVIDVIGNNLGGRIPEELGSLSTLSRLLLAKNHFVGTIPPSLGNLSALRVLSLMENNLGGSIPSQLGQLSKLGSLMLSSINVSGTVPASLYNISSLEELSISANRLHGRLPAGLGSTLPNLQNFYVGLNQFDGPIPSSLANASGLVNIDIDTNVFIGPIPLNLGTLRDIEYLNFVDNLLGQSYESNNLKNFIDCLSNSSNLKFLDLGYNHWNSVLPHSIANLSIKLTTLGLVGNYYLSGNIPPGIGYLENLRKFGLSENMLTGSIPDSIGKLSKMGELYIYRTNISGGIPSSIGNLTRLSIFVLSENMLEGSILLQGIALQHNQLTGPIPEQIFDLPSLSLGLSLNNNKLTGLLSSKVGNLKNLRSLAVSENELFGEIPAALGSCQILEFLFMKGNFFSGTIPESFEQLKGIQLLDVSGNDLSGHIPSFLGELSSLNSLNLSYNMFDGEVPNKGVFKNISAFSVVGNNKLCGGIKALRLPACPAEVVEKRKKPLSRRVIILLAISLVIVAILTRRSRVARQQGSSDLELQNQYPRLSYAELLHATNGFSSTNVIGEGRYGSVYRGIVNSSEQVVAIKVLNLQEYGANKSFMAECESLRAIRHRNLVKLITSCSSINFKGDDFKALVFEFMKNGNLESWLHPRLSEQQDPKTLNIVQRLNIAIDVASALDYLHYHYHCETTIIHCDLKPSNILLDDDLCAHVSDFGLARILSATTCTSNHHQSSSISIRGTTGYIPQEYGMGAEVSRGGDMNSYGVLLLEMFTGKRPTDNMFSDNICLRSYAKMSLPSEVMNIVDPRLIVEEDEEPSRTNQNSTRNTAKVEVCLASVLQIGVSCSAELSGERMNARQQEMFLRNCTRLEICLWRTCNFFFLRSY